MNEDGWREDLLERRVRVIINSTQHGHLFTFILPVHVWSQAVTNAREPAQSFARLKRRKSWKFTKVVTRTELERAARKSENGSL